MEQVPGRNAEETLSVHQAVLNAQASNAENAIPTDVDLLRATTSTLSHRWSSADNKITVATLLVTALSTPCAPDDLA
jgi:hypothetical protein